MTKRVFIIHGWDGYPEEGWFPWLKSQLEALGFEVRTPAMPNPSSPEIKAWVQQISATVGTPDANTYFVGHSIGCQAILRYLESLPADTPVGGAVFVAGWLVLGEKETEEAKIIAAPWVQTPIDFAKVLSHIKTPIAIFSDDDDVIPATNQKLFPEHLHAKVVIEHEKGHFSGGDNVVELPSALEAVKKLAA